MNASRTFSLKITFLSTLIAIIIYLIMIYVVVPIFEFLLKIFGRIFVPESLGGGRYVDKPSLIEAIWRGGLMNAVSVYAALKTSALFEDANIRVVAFLLGLFIFIGICLFTLVFYKTDGLSALIIPVVAAPSYYLIYIAWRDEGF